MTELLNIQLSPELNAGAIRDELLNRIRVALIKNLRSVKWGSRVLFSTTTTTTGWTNLVLYTESKALAAIELGSKPHKVMRTTGKVVPMIINGKKVFRKVSMRDAIDANRWKHPGSPGKLIIKTTWDKMKEGGLDEF